METIIVTTALPYANGPLHLGHMLENIQADIFVRAMKLLKKNVIFCCADDTHGTPIEINAMKSSMSPEDFIKIWYDRHVKDFKGMLVEFDSYYTTHSKENKEFSDLFFKKLFEKKYIYKKDIKHMFCEKCKRFLPDRFIKGTCPKCGAKDQYGDVCEKCGASYSAIEMKNVKCIICNTEPVLKESTHYFFKLTAFHEKLENWLKNNDNIQDDIKNYVLEWIKSGLRDWDISRDSPYFGFKIVGEKDKYYYVWFDAPIGYISSLQNYCKKTCNAIHLWNSKSTKVVHFIGKDIAYFHFLFWPAMLMGVEFKLPYTLIVHGFLTINGEKLSKSRGTMITVEEYLRQFDPEHLRYYFASFLSRSISDIDLSFSEFKVKINNELIAKICNFIYRVLSFSKRFLNSTIYDFSIGLEEESIITRFNELNYNAIKCYKDCNFKDIIKIINEMAEIGNEYFQNNKPWEIIKKDSERCKHVVSFSANIAINIAILLKPITPKIVRKVEEAFGFELTLKKFGFMHKNLKLRDINILTQKVVEDKFFDPFSRIDVRVCKIIDIEDIGNYYVLTLRCKERVFFTVAKIKGIYSINELKNKLVLCLCNSKEREIAGRKSNSILLGTIDNGKVRIIFVDGIEGDEAFVDGIKKSIIGSISYDFFKSLKLNVKNGKIYYNKKEVRFRKSKIITKSDGFVI